MGGQLIYKMNRRKEHRNFYLESLYWLSSYFLDESLKIADCFYFLLKIFNVENFKPVQKETE